MQHIRALRDLVARGKQLRPELPGRSERATLIALFRCIEPQEAGSRLVESDRTPGQVYRVTGARACPGHAPAETA